MSSLNPDKALIFRITHIRNIPWILQNGVHCRNSTVFDPNYVEIGNPELIRRRQERPVPVAPGGTLSDYVPFYFTPFSIMLYNIKTGYGGIRKVPNEEIVILVSSLRRVHELGIHFVFTDGHAYSLTANYFNDLASLDRVDWPLLQARDFRHDPDDPGKKERYQAEALVYQKLPISAVLGMGCHSKSANEWLKSRLVEANLELDIVIRPGWYF
ncbi:MAG: DUF4433 domain-containing protein [Opitutales bacterium]|nr:DUF4433 domain-containing protein [Opitutales bacterium]